MKKKYRFMVALNGKAVETTAETPLEALKDACNQWGIRWQSVVADTIITKLREVKEGTNG